MQVSIDTSDGARKLVLDAETKIEAWDLAAIYKTLETNGVTAEVLFDDAVDRVALALPLPSLVSVLRCS